MNRLWVCRSTAENIARAEKFTYFKANAKYCLVITDETPENMAEVTPEAARSLTMQDWTWIKAASERIKAEKEYAEFQRQQRDFISRFEKELENAKERMTDAGNPEHGGTEE